MKGLIVVAWAALVAACCLLWLRRHAIRAKVDAGTTAPSYVDYDIAEAHIRFQYPSDWEVRPHGDKGESSTVRIINSHVPAHVFHRNLAYSFHEVPPNGSLDAAKHYTYLAVNTFLKDHRIVSTKSTIIAGYPAYEIVASGSFGSQHVCMVYSGVILKDSYMLSLMYTFDDTCGVGSIAEFEELARHITYK